MYDYKYYMTVEDTMLAYCDCFFSDKKQGIAMELRSLQFCGDQFLPLAQWVDLMKAACPFGYNNFDPEKVGKEIKKLAQTKKVPLKLIQVCPAREFSVAMYISIQDPKVLSMLRSVDIEKVLDADTSSIITIHCDKAAFRVWWD